MKTARLILAIALLFSAGCAKRDVFLASQRTDPAPLVEIIQSRSEAANLGITGELAMDFRDTKRHFRGDGYIILTPAGNLRLEIPGLFGSTVLLMVSDETGTTVYYPSDSIAYRTSSSEQGLSSLLPFPMPLAPSTLAEILTGTVFPVAGSEQVAAFEGESGKKLLTFSDDTGTDYRYLFSNGPSPRLSELSVTLDKGKLVVSFSPEENQLIESFRYTNGDIRMKGTLQRVKFSGDSANTKGRSPFTLELPSGVIMKELGEE